MTVQFVDKTIVVADIFAVLATVYFILIAIFTKDPCFSLVESYAVVTPVFTSYFAKTYKTIFIKQIERGIE